MAKAQLSYMVGTKRRGVYVTKNKKHDSSDALENYLWQIL